jgi:Ca2+-binding RTX toxin-like protein
VHEVSRPDVIPWEDGGWWSTSGESPAYWDYALNELPPELRAALTGVDEYGNPIEPTNVPIAGLDTLRFGAGIAPQDVQVSRQGDSLVIAHRNGLDSVNFQDWFAHYQRWDSTLGQWVDLGQRPQVLGRIEFADGTVWHVLPTGEIEVAVDTVTLDGTDGADAIYATDGTPTIINGGAGNDLLVGADQADTINAGSDDDTVYGNAGNDALDGGDGDDTMYGWDGDDTLRGGNGVDRLYGDAGNDVVDGGAGDDTLFGWTGHDQLRGGEGNDVIGGDDGNDLVDGGAGSDALFGWSGRDVVQGGAGWDYMDGGANNDALTGGTEGDTLLGGGGGDFLAGGGGNDGLRLGGGADIVAFNRGDGADTVYAPTVGEGAGERNDTLSLAGIRYPELRLAREGDDLLLKVDGTTDAVRIESWYLDTGNQTVSTLQMIVDSTADFDAASADPLVNRRIARLNFHTLVAAFDAAYSANPSIGDWAIPAATLNSALVASSDTDAIGGQLAYRYGRDGNLAGLDFATASAVLADANFGTAAQSIGSGPTSGGVRLMQARASEPAAIHLTGLISTGRRHTLPSAEKDRLPNEVGPRLEESTAIERVSLPRLPSRWAGELVQADGTWVKLPAAVGPVAQEGESATAPMAICDLGEAGAREVGAPYRATGGVPGQGAPWAAPAVERVFIPRAPRVQPLTAAKVETAIAAAEARLAPADDAPAQAVAALAGAPAGADLACGRISARWRSIDAWLRAEQGHGTAALLGGEALDATSALPRLDSGAAAWALDEPRRAVRAPRTVMVA